MITSHLNRSYAQHCNPITLNNNDQVSNQLKEKFDRVCYLIRFFDTTHFNPLNFGAMNHNALVQELSQLLNEFEYLKNNTQLSEKERFIAATTYTTVALFIEKFQQMQQKMQVADVSTSSLKSNSEQGVDLDTILCVEDPQTLFYNDKYTTFLALQLIHILFSMKLTTHQIQEVEHEFQMLFVNSTESWFYFMELEDIEINSIEMAKQLRDHFSIISVNLILPLYMFYSLLEKNHQNNPDFNHLLEVSDIFKDKMKDLIINESKDSEIIIDMEIAKFIYQQMMQQIKVPG